MSENRSTLRVAWPAVWLAICLIFTSMAGVASAQPTVNGLFYGDGDDAFYVHWDTSFYGSKLYVFYHAPTTTLYVALVVNRSVNDNVFGPDDFAGFSGDYMTSAGWGQGGGQQRPASRLVDSEFASFDFACAENSPRHWAWQQGYACLQSGTWVSDSTCSTSAVITNGFPPTFQSASSFAWNINTYNAASPKPWNRDVFGGTTNRWRSPYSSSNPNTSPPNNPNTVLGLEGYPAPTNSGDLSQGPDITFNSTYQYEWPMVYEWSLDLGSGGTNCENNALFLLTGQSHHSPMKAGVEGEFDDECGEENDCFPPGGGDNPLSDYGDLPDTYGTLTANNGPRHPIIVNGPFLGTALEIETDGQPTGDATGDGDEEDGVTAVVDGNWTAGSTQSIEVEVANGPAVLGGWFDWNGDGDFNDPGEFFTWNVTSGTNTLDVTVGSGFDWQTDNLYARFRIFSSGSAAPGGSLDSGDSVGLATDGEVEDYFFVANSLPVTLNAVSSERTAGGDLLVRWQTASETDNVGFEVWGQVDGEWQALTDLIASRSMTSGLPQTYEARISAPEGLTALELVDYDTRGRSERFGSFHVGVDYGELQPVRAIDWTGPRSAREQRLRERGFENVARRARVAGPGLGIDDSAPARLKKLRQGEPRSATGDDLVTSSLVFETAKGRSKNAGPSGGDGTLELSMGPSTHVAVTEPGIQRVTYEALRDGGLDLAGVQAREVAVTWRGEPVERWIGGGPKLGPGSYVEFLGRPPQGDDALYVDANLYQVSVDASKAASPGTTGMGKARDVSPSYLREQRVDRQEIYRQQSPSGDPWVEHSVLVRPGRTTTVTLDLAVEGPVADGPSHLTVGLGTVSDLADLRDGAGEVIPEHNAEVWFREPGGTFAPVATASTSGRQDWTLEATLPEGWLTTGVHQIQLRFSTEYFFSLVVVDDYGVRYPSPYRGPALDFAADPQASGYRIEGFQSPDVVAYTEDSDGSLTRLMPRVAPAAGGYAAELRQLDAERFWVTESPHAPEVFTTEAPSDDLLAGPADLVVLADSSFLGTRALEDYLSQRSAFDPVVVDVEDVYNAVGFGMALPSAITDYLRVRDQVHPFTHVQLVGADCFDRLNYISQCVSFLPLPTAPVGVNVYTPSQNRLVDLDGDGIGDKAVAQFSVRDTDELATVVAKADAWNGNGLSATESVLFIAEEFDGVHDFAAQVGRLERRLGWPQSEILDLGDHPQIQTARDAMRTSLDEGRAITVFSGHSSPTVWSFRGLLTTSVAASLTNVGLPTVMVPLACETTYDVSPTANVLGHQLLFANDGGALAISGAVALANLDENERMANHVLSGLDAGLTLGEAVLAGRRALGTPFQELQDNWVTQGDVAVSLRP